MDYGTATSALHAELEACFKSLFWATSQHIRNAIIYRDFANLIYSLQAPCSAPISIKWTINHIITLARNMEYCFLLKVNRQQVHAFHVLAKKCVQTCS